MDAETAWRKWDEGKEMTPDELMMLRQDDQGNRLLPTKRKSVPSSIDLGAFTGELAAIVKEALARNIGPLEKRLAAMETELKAGADRLKKLEAKNDP